MNRRISGTLIRCVLVAVCGFAAMAPAARGQTTQEQLEYVKVFPGSSPEYQQLRIERDGSGVYQEARQEADPVNLQLPAKLAEQLFDLLKELNYLKDPLESGLDIAKMGEKTFRYTGAQSHQQTFNYTTAPAGQKLLDLCERIAESQRLFLRLEYTVKFDRLGVNDALLAVDAAMRRERLMGVPHMLPLLDDIINSKRYMNISRSRADAIARALRNGQSTGEPSR
ncbi:MAG: hypothetical protein MUF01_17125 [Bryobacterales bacterium]|nr:hypothetical protein [Bryobacterales bacterium]